MHGTPDENPTPETTPSTAPESATAGEAQVETATDGGTEAAAAAEAPAPAEPAATDSAPAAEEAAPAESAPAEAAEAAAAATTAVAETPKSGARLKGKIVKVGEDSAFVDFGGREEAVIDIRELKDPDGKLTRKVGDEVQVIVKSADESGVKVSLKVGKGTPANLPQLIEAAKTGVPIEGKVTGVNKGGLVVQVLGVRAFCPFSQIDRHYVEDPSGYVNQKFSFRVSSADPKGRNVVLSRRALLEEEAKGKAAEIRDELKVGAVIKGVVARIRPFGAFVDLGGVDGLVHISEVSHTRVKDPSEVLKVGQEVDVKVRAIEDLGGAKERISLSLKDLAPDPWESLVNSLGVGSKVSAKVARLTDFGAFMELAPGVDGLAHVSTLAQDRVNHPSDVVSVGQEVEVWVLSVDPDSRRISLSIVEPGTESYGGGGGGGGRRGEDRGGRGGGGGRRGPGGGGGRGQRRSSPELDEYQARQRQEREAGSTSMAEALRRAGLGEE